MFKATHKMFSLAFAATLVAGTVRAQSLDGEVVRNPNDTVTYTIDLDGPPRGHAQLFVSIGLAPMPWELFPFGQVYLNPSQLVPLTPLLPLDPAGKGNFQAVIPAHMTAGLPLVFQTVNIDAASTIRLSMNAIALVQNVVPVAAPAPVIPFGYTFAYDTGGSVLRMAGRGKPGSVVEIRIIDSNGTRVTEKATVGADGKFFLSATAPGGITTDDDVMVIHDGSMVDKIDLYKF